MFPSSSKAIPLATSHQIIFDLWNLSYKYPATFISLLTVGTLLTALRIYQLLSFIHLHFLRQSSLSSLKNAKTSSGSDDSWALITGASDGIGKGFAEELCERGFNVILHGRNPKKLAAVVKELQERWPDREVRTFVLDAGSSDAESASRLSAFVKDLQTLDLSLLINNVGGSAGVSPLWIPLHENPDDRVGLFLNLNARFTTELTRLLLPRLAKRSEASLVLNIGSITGDVPSPYLSVYSGTKAYLKAWSRSLALEMRMERHFSVEVLHVVVGAVATTSSGFTARNLFVPSPRRMAKGALDKAGCGRDVVFGYWAHELQMWALGLIPGWIADLVLSRAVGEIKAREEKDTKKAEQDPKP